MPTAVALLSKELGCESELMPGGGWWDLRRAGSLTMAQTQAILEPWLVFGERVCCLKGGWRDPPTCCHLRGDGSPRSTRQGHGAPLLCAAAAWPCPSHRVEVGGGEV